MKDIRSIKKIDLEGKRVFIRVDFNVPYDKDMRITDDSRITAAVPTIQYAIDHGAKIILASHLGRPKGKRTREFSLMPVGARLAELLKTEVFFPDDCIGDGPKKVVMGLKEGDVMLLENLRFYPEEEANDEGFAAKLASLADVYINDAFGAAHRAHASVSAIAGHFKSKGAGLLLEKEIEYLGRLLAKPETPFIVVLGGAKVSDKIGAINNLLSKVNAILVGGAMGTTFLKAKGYFTGMSKIEEDNISVAESVISKAEYRNVDLMLPSDVSVVSEIKDGSEVSIKKIDQIGEKDIIIDIGPETAELFRSKIAAAKTIFWNGPMGIFEINAFSRGTENVARSIANSAAMSVAGGGDTVSAINKFVLNPFFTHISTGGGASLEFLEGLELPGIAALKEA
jgi:phosphoglycerate kinase